MTALLERHHSGFRVVLALLEDGSLELTGETALHTETVKVPGSEALEAFRHPCLYFVTPSLFFKAPPEGAPDSEFVPVPDELIPF